MLERRCSQDRKETPMPEIKKRLALRFSFCTPPIPKYQFCWKHLPRQSSHRQQYNKAKTFSPQASIPKQASKASSYSASSPPPKTSHSANPRPYPTTCSKANHHHSTTNSAKSESSRPPSYFSLNHCCKNADRQVK